MFTRVFPRFGSSRLFLGSFRSSFASSSSRPNRTEPFGRGRWRERTRWRGKEPSMNGPFTSLYVPFGPFLGSFHLPLGPSYRRALREEVSGGRMTKRADKQRDREEWDTSVHSFLPHRLVSSSSLRSLRSLRSENDMRVRMRSTGTNMEGRERGTRTQGHFGFRLHWPFTCPLRSLLIIPVGDSRHVRRSSPGSSLACRSLRDTSPGETVEHVRKGRG